MTDDADRAAAIVQARALARVLGATTFVFRRPLPPPPPFVITNNEALAAAECDATGYARCEPTQEADDD
jgi:hypothetical protein